MQNQLHSQGPMDVLFQIRDCTSGARADLKSISHAVDIYPFHGVIKSTFRYEINSDISSAILSIPKSNDSALEDLQVTVTGPGIQSSSPAKKLTSMKKADADALIQKTNFRDLVQGIASEDIKHSTILVFQMGGLKRGYQVTVVIQHNMDTKTIYTADRTLTSFVLPAGLSLLYEEPIRMATADQILKKFYKDLQDMTTLTSLTVTLKVPSPEGVTISSPKKTKTEDLLKYSSIEHAMSNSSRMLKFTLANPKYSDWSKFRIDAFVTGSAGTQDISVNHASKLEFFQTTLPPQEIATLPVTGLLRLRHFTPFPQDLQQNMLQNAQYRDSDLPEIEFFKKYMATRQEFDVFFLLDQSGSMTDCNRHNLAIQGLKYSLRSLVPNSSRFNIYTFNTSYKKLYQTLQDTNEMTIQSTEGKLDALQSDGTTVLFDALQDVFSIPMVKNRKRIIVLLSDGELTGKVPETMALFKTHMQHPDMLLCGLCVGTDGPVKLFNELKPLTNGGMIAYIDDNESIPDAYIRLLKSSFYPTYWLTNFKITGGKALYMYPALELVQAAQAEVSTVSFLLSDLQPTVTLSYDVYFGCKLQHRMQESCSTAIKSTEAESMMRIEAQKIARFLIEQKDRAANAKDPNLLNPFNKTIKGQNVRMLPVIDRPQPLKFDDDLLRLGLRFNLITPLTSLVLNIEGVNKRAASELHEAPAHHAHVAKSFLSASRNASIMADFDKVRGRFGSAVQQEFERFLEDEAMMSSFGVEGKITYSPENAQRFITLGVISEERAEKLRTYALQEHKDYNFTKYIVMMILKFKGDTDRWSMILGKCCKYLEECVKLKYHEVPDCNPFALKKPNESRFLV